MDEIFKERIAAAKRDYEAEGFIVVGAFGSRARGDFGVDSDLDLLYRIEDHFLEHHPGWAAYKRVDEIKDDLARRLGKPIDVAYVDALDDVGRKYIAPELVHVS